MIIETLWLRIDPDGNSKSVGMIYNEVLRVCIWLLCPKLESLLCAFRKIQTKLASNLINKLKKEMLDAWLLFLCNYMHNGPNYL